MKNSCNYIRVDHLRREKFSKYETTYLLRKSIILNENFSIAQRSFFIYQTFLKKSRIKNFCRLSGKSKTVFKLIGLSRMPFRFILAQRLLSGFKRFNR